ncbi:ribosomal-processing cysteine protease Prp [Paenibacillus sp. N1-5-1-14]|uniref:ribosomal-processing cysteine protease Prp n=1 Tax=Paenibacillus radicibacter TaxID=2972488 RepID=UPI002159A89C|nr:ribosomal-processing cysteine protease Prp [Paenibacillus radicibacter]MCR8644135.1 ribosomal-processing cysteine protease Prp [Paenibacillus radicibacter]
MIQVTIWRADAKDSAITAFKVVGHADYDVRGKDIVCAAVSAITVGTVNAIEELTRVKLKAKVKSGYMLVDIPQGIDSQVAERVSLILDSMVVMLNTIEITYSKYINVQTSYSKGG